MEEGFLCSLPVCRLFPCILGRPVAMSHALPPPFPRDELSIKGRYVIKCLFLVLLVFFC